MSHKSFLKNSIAVGALTLLSRITGLLRDLFIAKYLGAGKFADCFLTAFKIPNLFRSIFAEGAFNSAFVPIFSGLRKNNSEKETREFCNSLFALLFYILLIITLIAEIFMPFMLDIFAPGFRLSPDKFELAVSLSRITFPFLFFVALTSFFGSILNTLGIFKPYAMQPIILNLCMIFALQFFTKLFPNPAYVASWGVSISGVLQLVILFITAKKYGFGIISFKFNFSKHIIQFFRRIGPGIIGAGIYHLNILIGSIFATQTDGAVSWIYYADRLNQLPLGVIGVAVATVLLPSLSREIAAKRQNKSEVIFNKALKFSSILAIPAATSLIAISYIVIQIFFERGAFRASDTYATSQILQILCLSLPALIFNKLFANVFYAHKDTKTPMIISGICLVCNVILTLIITKSIGYLGIIFAITISNWVNFVLLYYISFKRGYMRIYKTILYDIIKMSGVSVFLGILIYFGSMGMMANIGIYSLLTRIVMLGFLILINAIFYFILLLILKVIDLKMIKQYMKG